MSALYFDCFSGISGDMTLGALLDLGIERTYLLDELEKLGLHGFHISFEKAVKNGITGNYVKVNLDPQSDIHGHHQHGSTHQESSPLHQPLFSVEYTSHSHFHRSLSDINDLIENSGIRPGAKDLAKRIFLRIAKAEAKVHNRPVEQVHFHEVGAVDSIVDIVGCAILIDKLKPDVVYASVINDGRGFIQCQHGRLSVPVPAVSEIFASSDVIARQIDVEAELVTPTGAAIIAELAASYGNMPPMKVKKIGWGAGTKDLTIPNLLKISMGELVNLTLSSNQTINPMGSTGTEETDQVINPERVMILETNIDDCSGEILGYAMERLMEAGALDVYYTPIFMKKNRPAYCLTVITWPHTADKMEQLIFRHTTTIGIRKHLEERTVLPRRKDICHTAFGELQVKKVMLDGAERIYPEYESARKLAYENGVSLSEVYQSVVGCENTME